MAVGAQPHDPPCQLQMEQQQQEQQQQEQQQQEQQQQQALLRVRRGAMGAEGEERRGGAQVPVTGATAPRGHLNCPKL
jgi:transcription initiation factor TFIID subunit TAF12